MGKPRVLCVDDEEAILEGLHLALRKGFRVTTALGGEEALEKIEENGPFPLVVSDMRMPGMSGAEFLAAVRERYPQSMRILLTGQTDMSSAIAAVNEGQVFRFLTKPCPGAELVPVLNDALEIHRLRESEAVLLDQTLRGSIKALTDLLAMTHPTVFGRSTRVSTTIAKVRDLADAPSPAWPLEIAAMVCQVGHVTLDESLAERMAKGQISEEESEQCERANVEVLENILSTIPRMEPVIAILRDANSRPRGRAPAELIESDLLRLAVQLDVLTSRGGSVAHSLDVLRQRKNIASPLALDLLHRALGEEARKEHVQEIPIRHVRVGMVFTEDVLTMSGLLLIARGFTVTPSFVLKARGFRPGYVAEPVRVMIPE